jgi:hypothetical protein
MQAVEGVAQGMECTSDRRFVAAIIPTLSCAVV